MASKFKQDGTSLDKLNNVQLWDSQIFKNNSDLKYSPPPEYKEFTNGEASDITYVKYNSGVLTNSDGNDRWGDICVGTGYNIKDDNDQWVPLPLADKISCPILRYYDGKSTISDKLSSTTAIGTNDFSSTSLYIRATYSNGVPSIQVRKGTTGNWTTVKEGHAGFWFTLVGGGGGGGDFGYHWLSGFVAGGGGGGGGCTIIGYINLADHVWTSSDNKFLKITTGKGGQPGAQSNDGGDGGNSTITWISNSDKEVGSLYAGGGGGGDYPLRGVINGGPYGGLGGGSTTEVDLDCKSGTTNGLIQYVVYRGGGGGKGTSNGHDNFSFGDNQKGKNIQYYGINCDSVTNVSDLNKVSSDDLVYDFQIFSNIRKVLYTTSDKYAIGGGGTSTTSYTTSTENWQANGGGGGACLMGGFNGHTACGYGYGGHGASTAQSTGGQTASAGGNGCFMMYI